MKNRCFRPFFLALLLFSSAPLYAVFSLRVGDPRVSASTQQGTIEAAVLSVRPRGLYLEYGLYLTFSARGASYQAQDSLEVTLKFELPAGAIVHDSWLWINDDIVRARILDRWTASSIYEGIVQRRQDPSILFKNSATQYELRIFPMNGNATRKVKITYLVPAGWSRETVEGELPVAILKTSKNQLQTFHLLAWPDADFQNPALVNTPQVVFSEKTDSVFGAYRQAILPAANQTSGLRLAFDSPLKNGPYLRVLQDGQSGLYQLAVLPARLFEHEAARKVVLLIDYEAGAGATTAEALLQELRAKLLRDFTPLDSFNIIVSGLSPQAVSPVWLPADPASAAAAFDAAAAQLASYSNLAPLLVTGINFIKNNGNAGALLVASNATQYGNYTAANLLITDMLALLGTPPVPVHTLNYNNSNTPYYYIGGKSYYGNDYFFTNISKLSGGDFQTVRGTTLAAAVSLAVDNLGAFLRSFDFHTTLENGYCYGRFFIDAEPDIAYLNKPILQVGKFQGDFPFIVELAGELDGQFVSADIAVPASEIQSADSLTREIWYGNYIRLLETETQTNSAIAEIVYNSLAERVLSLYTAFLCLEDVNQFCPTCPDESQLVGSAELAARDSLLRAWPNPFAEQVTISVRTAADAPFGASSSLEIYTAGGQLVRQFRLNEFAGETAAVVWDGRNTAGNAVAPGVYLAVARIHSGQVRVLKLVRQG